MTEGQHTEREMYGPTNDRQERVHTRCWRGGPARHGSVSLSMLCCAVVGLTLSPGRDTARSRRRNKRSIPYVFSVSQPQPLDPCSHINCISSRTFLHDHGANATSHYGTCRVVFVVETSEGDDFAFTIEMVNFGAFSVAKEAAVTGTCPHPPAKYHSGDVMKMDPRVI